MIGELLNKMIRTHAGSVINYCDLDDLLNTNCINCPYNIGKDISCILSEYEEMRLL